MRGRGGSAHQKRVGKRTRTSEVYQPSGSHIKCTSKASKTRKAHIKQKQSQKIVSPVGCTSMHINRFFYLESGLADRMAGRSSPQKRKRPHINPHIIAHQRIVPPRHRTSIRTSNLDSRAPALQTTQFAHRSCAHQCTSKCRKQTNPHINPIWCLWEGGVVGRSVGRPQPPFSRACQGCAPGERFNDSCLGSQAVGGRLWRVGRRGKDSQANVWLAFATISQPDQDLADHGWGLARKMLPNNHLIYASQAKSTLQGSWPFFGRHLPKTSYLMPAKQSRPGKHFSTTMLFMRPKQNSFFRGAAHPRDGFPYRFFQCLPQKLQMLQRLKIWNIEAFKQPPCEIGPDFDVH